LDAPKPLVLCCGSPSGGCFSAKSLAQFSAYHLREIIFNLDMLAIARTTKLTATSKEKAEDETLEYVNAPGPLGETEFYGGEQTDEPENDDVAVETGARCSACRTTD